MRVPNTVSLALIKVYGLPANIYMRNERLKSEHFLWDGNFVESLKEICLKTIAQNWAKYPIYEEIKIPENRSILIDLLPTNLPLELTIPKLHNDVFWERCYRDRWPNSLPRIKYVPKRKNLFKILQEEITDDHLSEIISINSESSSTSVISDTGKSSVVDIILKKYAGPELAKKSWKIHYLERHLEEELERMKPDMFNPEYIKELTDLLSTYIFNLTLKQLKSSSDASNIDHISLHSLLARLPNLREFSVCFTEGNVGENFRWHLRNVSENDCRLLGNGVAKSKMEILRIVRSNIDCSKIKLVLQSICNHRTLKILDLSHCKIADNGALALAEMFRESPGLEKAILCNNKIGPKGAEGLAYYLCLPESRLLELNLKLNPVKVEGGKHIATALARGARFLESLSLSSCGLTNENIHFGDAIALNTTLKKLDLSNNHLGEEFGQNFLDGLKRNLSLQRVDLRMSGISANTVQEIEIILKENLIQRRDSTAVLSVMEDS